MLKSMNDALAYIESQLNDEIDYTELEKITGTSFYHFRRIFSFMTGMSLAEYIRKRKLSNAMFDLLHEGISVTEAAFNYGYESVEGFSRAFQEWSGIKPSEVKSKSMLKSFPKLSFKLSVQGGINMEFSIVEKPPFKIVGVKKRVLVQFEGENKEIIELAKSITKEQREKLNNYANVEPNQVVNASYNFDDGRMNEQGSLDHMIGVLTTKSSTFEDFDVEEIPALTWVKFRSEGEFPKVMQETWGKIFSEWLPSSNFELVEAPEISFTGDLTDISNVRSEIWIAVKKKGHH